MELNFDDLVNLETMFIEIGKEDGVRAGFNSGKLEGYVLGCEKGFEISQEIGFYSGMTEIWLKFIVDSDDSPNLLPNINNKRIIKQLESLRELISTFPIENQQNIEFLDLLNKIRSKFKVCASLLGVTNIQKFKNISEIDDKVDNDMDKSEKADKVNDNIGVDGTSLDHQSISF